MLQSSLNSFTLEKTRNKILIKRRNESENFENIKFYALLPVSCVSDVETFVNPDDSWFYE